MLKINKDIQIGDTGRTLEMLGETVAETLPVGTIAPYGGSTSQVPQNWLPCDGREVSRLEYAKLFSIIGTRFGTGDGSTTFNLPDLQGKIPVGQDVNDAAFDVLGETGGEKEHTLTVNEMPSHTHSYTYSTSVSDWPSRIPLGSNAGVGTSGAGISTTGGGQAHNNLQPYQVTLYIIKAFDQQLGNLRSESLPVGSEIDFAGAVGNIPEGWEQVDDYAKILWTNSSPNSSFANQTIQNLSLSDYDLIEVFCKNYANSQQNSVTSVKIPKNYNGYLSYTETDGAVVNRLATVNWSGSSIIFADAKFKNYNTTTIATTDNNRAIPIYIVGYKTGLFS